MGRRARVRSQVVQLVRTRGRTRSDRGRTRRRRTQTTTQRTGPTESGVPTAQHRCRQQRVFLLGRERRRTPSHPVVTHACQSRILLRQVHKRLDVVPITLRLQPLIRLRIVLVQRTLEVRSRVEVTHAGSHHLTRALSQRRLRLHQRTTQRNRRSPIRHHPRQHLQITSSLLLADPSLDVRVTHITPLRYVQALRTRDLQRRITAQITPGPQQIQILAIERQRHETTLTHQYHPTHTPSLDRIPTPMCTHRATRGTRANKASRGTSTPTNHPRTHKGPPHTKRGTPESPQRSKAIDDRDAYRLTIAV